MGLYVFTNFSVAYSTNAYTISIQGKDKMCLLNGTVSGSFFASITFDTEEYTDTTTGITTITKLPVKYIIQEAVHEYAGEPFYNILVNDLDDLGLELLRYNGVQPIYVCMQTESGDAAQVTQIIPYGTQTIYARQDGNTVSFTLNDMSEEADAAYKLDTRTVRIELPSEGYQPTVCYLNEEDANNEDKTKAYTIAKYTYGQTVGYRTTDIIYAGDLVGNVGESVASILDKSVAMLGQFEYFYDLDGHFVFQKQANYIDHTYNPIVSSENGSDDLYAESNAYVENAAYASATYWTFENNEFITAFNNTPDLLNIKNDFSLWGERTTVSGTTLPVHMRFGIGKRPTFYTTYEGLTFLTKEEDERITAYNANHKDYSVVIRTDNYAGLSSDWWKVPAWAEYYAICTAVGDGMALTDINA